jgi:hypothetical protein
MNNHHQEVAAAPQNDKGQSKEKVTVTSSYFDFIMIDNCSLLLFQILICFTVIIRLNILINMLMVSLNIVMFIFLKQWRKHFRKIVFSQKANGDL